MKKDVDQRDADRRTPLHYAVAYDHLDIAHQLLDAGASLEATVSSTLSCHDAQAAVLPLSVMVLVGWAEWAVRPPG